MKTEFTSDETKNSLIGLINKDIDNAEYAIKNGYRKSIAGHCESTKLDGDDLKLEKESLAIFRSAIEFILNGTKNGLDALESIAEGEFGSAETSFEAGSYLRDIEI